MQGASQVRRGGAVEREGSRLVAGTQSSNDARLAPTTARIGHGSAPKHLMKLMANLYVRLQAQGSADFFADAPLFSEDAC